MRQEDAESLEVIRQRRRAFAQCFGSPAGQEVLKELAGFCCAADSCVAAPKNGPVDIQRTLILEGRREVWLSIQRTLNLTPEQLYWLATGRHVQITEVEDGS